MAHKLKTDKKITIITLASFVLTMAGIIVLIVLPKDFWSPKKKEWQQSRLIVPQTQNGQDGEIISNPAERMIYEAAIRPAVPLSDGEIQIAVISEDLDSDGVEEQVIAYRNLLEADNPVYITYIDYDERTREYKRVWSAQTAATRPGTISLITADLIGDHNNCVVVTGMNQNDENTLTAFQILPRTDEAVPPYKRIARVTIDGTISINEVERSQAYQLGYAQGVSYNITERGHDPYSANNLDQIETTWSFDAARGMYIKTNTVKIPGAQIEATMLRTLLSGGKQEFEKFIDGLWYHINAEGTIDNNRYIYFDTANREVNFYSEDTQQVYGWQSSYATRYGLFISSQNISVATLNRKIDIELESIDSIRVRVSEDVRMRILMSAPWDGSYRKAKSLYNAGAGNMTVQPYIDAVYNSPMGKISFSAEGDYTVDSHGEQRTGKYVFYKIGKNELLELVPAKESRTQRQTYRVERNGGSSAPELSLVRVKLGINGLYEFHEAPISLN